MYTTDELIVDYINARQETELRQLARMNGLTRRETARIQRAVRAKTADLVGARYWPRRQDRRKLS